MIPNVPTGLDAEQNFAALLFGVVVVAGVGGQMLAEAFPLGIPRIHYRANIVALMVVLVLLIVVAKTAPSWTPVAATAAGALSAGHVIAEMKGRFEWRSAEKMINSMAAELTRLQILEHEHLVKLHMAEIKHMSPLEHMIATNPEGDPDRIAKFITDLGVRRLFLLLPGDALPHGGALLSEEDVVRLTNPVVWAPDGVTPVSLDWGGAQLYEMPDENAPEAA